MYSKIGLVVTGTEAPDAYYDRLRTEVSKPFLSDGDIVTIKLGRVDDFDVNALHRWDPTTEF